MANCAPTPSHASNGSWRGNTKPIRGTTTWPRAEKPAIPPASTGPATALPGAASAAAWFARRTATAP